MSPASPCSTVAARVIEEHLALVMLLKSRDDSTRHVLCLAKHQGVCMPCRRLNGGGASLGHARWNLNDKFKEKVKEKHMQARSMTISHKVNTAHTILYTSIYFVVVYILQGFEACSTQDLKHFWWGISSKVISRCPRCPGFFESTSKRHNADISIGIIQQLCNLCSVWSRMLQMNLNACEIHEWRLCSCWLHLHCVWSHRLGASEWGKDEHNHMMISM